MRSTRRSGNQYVQCSSDRPQETRAPLRRRSERCASYALSAVRSAAGTASLLEAIGAVQWLAAGWLEGNLGLSAAFVADGGVHLARSAGARATTSSVRTREIALVLTRVAAIATANRLVLEPTTLIEFLLTRGPDKGVSAVATGDGFILEAHRRSPLWAQNCWSRIARLERCRAVSHLTLSSLPVYSGGCEASAMGRDRARPCRKQPDRLTIGVQYITSTTREGKRWATELGYSRIRRERMVQWGCRRRL